MGAVLQTTGLYKKYGDKVVTDNISLTINKGDIYGFVGKNGAGKPHLCGRCLVWRSQTAVKLSCLTVCL